MGRRALVACLVGILGAVHSAQVAAAQNVVLITIDTIRADYLGCNGSTRVLTPHLDRLAREGANFTRARSPVPLTLPAHASILTGNYPPTHTVRSNGEFRLPESQVSLAEVLQDLGYRTAAFVSSFVLDRRFGLAQGFDHYDDRVWSGVGELEKLEAERTGGEVFKAFSGWLSEDSGSGSFFVWIHLYDPHAPYEPPELFRDQYPKDPYGGEVAYADSIVGQILSELESKDRLSNTLVAVTGDHGEGLGDHGEMTHSLLIYNSTLHVPMMIWAPGLVEEGRRVDDLVRVIDLAPTILDYLGVPDGLGEGISVRSKVDRGSVRAGIESEALTAYSESLYPELALMWSPLRGLESAHHRLILAPRSELFSVTDDPGERENSIDAEPAVYQRLKSQLVKAMREFDQGSSSSEVATADSDSRQKLASLGYLSGSKSAGGRRGPLPDPKENIKLWDRIQAGIARVGMADFRQAIQIFESVLEVDPDIPLIYEYLGTSWRALAAQDEAEKIYRLGLSRGLRSTRLHSELGRILLERGEIEEAAREMQAALALDPRSVVVHYELGNLYRSQKEFIYAIEQYEAALEINPSYLWAYNGLGMSYAAVGSNDKALQAFRQVVEIDPLGPAGHFNLAVHLDRSGMKEQARRAYLEFLELADEEDYGVQRRQAQGAVSRP